LIDSILSIEDCVVGLEKDPKLNFSSGGLSGSIDTSSDKNLIVVAYNISSGEFWKDVVEDMEFTFSNLPVGKYLLQAYVNYNFNNETVHPYFPGRWHPFSPSLDFSSLIGPVEIRKNWDIEGISIKFD